MSKCQNLQRNQISLIIAQNEACAHVREYNTSSQESMKFWEAQLENYVNKCAERDLQLSFIETKSFCCISWSNCRIDSGLEEDETKAKISVDISSSNDGEAAITCLRWSMAVSNCLASARLLNKITWGLVCLRWQLLHKNLEAYSKQPAWAKSVTVKTSSVIKDRINLHKETTFHHPYTFWRSVTWGWTLTAPLVSGTKWW